MLFLYEAKMAKNKIKPKIFVSRKASKRDVFVAQLAARVDELEAEIIRLKDEVAQMRAAMPTMAYYPAQVSLPVISTSTWPWYPGINSNTGGLSADASEEISCQTKPEGKQRLLPARKLPW